jgi:hypothetical protein
MSSSAQQGPEKGTDKNLKQAGNLSSSGSTTTSSGGKKGGQKGYAKEGQGKSSGKKGGFEKGDESSGKKGGKKGNVNSWGKGGKKWGEAGKKGSHKKGNFNKKGNFHKKGSIHKKGNKKGSSPWSSHTGKFKGSNSTHKGDDVNSLLLADIYCAAAQVHPRSKHSSYIDFGLLAKKYPYFREACRGLHGNGVKLVKEGEGNSAVSDKLAVSKLAVSEECGNSSASDNRAVADKASPVSSDEPPTGTDTDKMVPVQSHYNLPDLLPAHVSVDYSDPKSLMLLTKAFLEHFYGIKNWSFPYKEGYLCPPVPRSANYLHFVADLFLKDLREWRRQRREVSDTQRQGSETLELLINDNPEELNCESLINPESQSGSDPGSSAPPRSSGSMSSAPPRSSGSKSSAPPRSSASGGNNEDDPKSVTDLATETEDLKGNTDDDPKSVADLATETEDLKAIENLTGWDIGIGLSSIFCLIGKAE